MKYSVLIGAAREPTLFPRLVRILYWQGVSPHDFRWEAVGAGTIRIRAVMECDPWRCRRLVLHWEKIVGVQSVVIQPLDGANADKPEEAAAAAEYFAPAAG